MSQLGEETEGSHDSTQDTPQIAAFLSWFQGLGGHLHPSLRYAQDATMGLSLFATEDMGPDSEACVVPKKCCITAELACRQIRSFLGEDVSSPDPLTGKEWVVLYLFLHKLEAFSPLHSSSEEEESNDAEGSGRKRQRLERDFLAAVLLHGPYIGLLPSETLSPLHYRKEEVALLRSTPLYGHAIESRKRGRRSFEKAMRWLGSALICSRGGRAVHRLSIILAPVNTSLNVGETGGDEVSLEDEWRQWGKDEEDWPLLKEWRWAETVYGSRAFPPRLLGEAEDARFSAPVLIPGLDSFNHARQARVTWTWHTTPAEHTSLTLHACSKKGQQVFNNYGAKSNEDFLASYGFVNEGMEDDTVTFKLGGAMGSSSKQHYWKYGEPCPPDLLDEVKASVRAAGGEDKQDRDGIDPLMEEGEAMEIITELLKQKISSFEAVQAQIQAESEGDTIRASVKANAGTYRRSQANIMYSALAQAQARLDELEQMLDEQVDTSAATDE